MNNVQELVERIRDRAHTEAAARDRLERAEKELEAAKSALKAAAEATEGAWACLRSSVNYYVWYGYS